MLENSRIVVKFILFILPYRCMTVMFKLNRDGQHISKCSFKKNVYILNITHSEVLELVRSLPNFNNKWTAYLMNVFSSDLSHERVMDQQLMS